MIWESDPWKTELRKFSQSIEVIADEKIHYDEAPEEEGEADPFFELEKTLFLSAFIMRKLIENKKITNKVAGCSIPLDAFDSLPNRETVASQITNPLYDVQGRYDIENPQKIQCSAHDLAGEIIHSFGLAWMISEDGRVDGLYLCSYKNEKKRALLLPIGAYVRVLNRIADDEAVGMRVWKKPSGKYGTEIF